MARYLPGAILAALGVIVYVTACLLYLACPPAAAEGPVRQIAAPRQ